MSRCLVNVATGRYLKGQVRLVREFERQSSKPIATATWTDSLPPGSPGHRERPYAFKAYALAEAAARGHDVLIWADASVLPIRPVDPIWERVERDGYWVALNGWTNYEWTADSAYQDLFPGVPIDEARAVNRTFPQVVATSFGVDLRTEVGQALLSEYARLAKTGAFVGPWANSNHPTDKDRYGMGSCYTTEPCGPPDVRGHRHDQTALSVIAWRLKLKLTQCPAIISWPPPGSDETILLVAGAPQ